MKFKKGDTIIFVRDEKNQFYITCADQNGIKLYPFLGGSDDKIYFDAPFSPLLCRQLIELISSIGGFYCLERSETEAVIIYEVVSTE